MRRQTGPAAVSYSTGCRHAAFWLSLFWLAGLVACAGGILLPASRRGAVEPAAAAFGALALCAWALWRLAVVLRRQQALLWTGNGWILRTTGGDVPLEQVTLAADLQALALVRAVPIRPARAHWLVLARRPAMDRDWHLLRCALYARQAAPNPTH